MKTISDYTIYCTAEQTKQALELGAQIEYAKVIDTINGNSIRIPEETGEFYLIPTAEQMIGWLQSKGCYPYTRPIKRDGKVMIVARFEFFEGGGSTDTFCGFGEDNSVILKAIDMALAYLSNKK